MAETNVATAPSVAEETVEETSEYDVMLLQCECY